MHVMNSSSASIDRAHIYVRSDAFGECDVEFARCRLETLQNAWELIGKNAEVLSQGADEQLQEEIQTKVAAAEEKYLVACAALKRKIRELEPAVQQQQNQQQQQPLAVQVNMPFQQHDIRNTWGEFDGNLTKWQGFRDRFISAIHANELVTPGYKFSHLKKSLTGKALRTLGEWQLTDENYQEAWKRLNEVYDKKYATCRELLRQFFKLPEIHGTPKANDLQRMSDVTYQTLRQLAAQGVPTQHWDMIVVHMLHERLDADTACKWEENRKTETPTAKEMCDFLEKHANVLENAQDNRRIQPKDLSIAITNERARMEKTNKASSLKRKDESDSKPSTSAQVKRMPCYSCKSMEHALWDCPDFLALSLKSRQDFVKERKVCPNCLKGGHGIDDCFQGPCIRCPNRPMHNSVLCPVKEVRKTAVLLTQETIDSARSASHKRKTSKERKQKYD